MSDRLRRVWAESRWLRAPCEPGYLNWWVVGVTGMSIVATPWMTPYSFGRDDLTRLEVVLAALQVAGILLALVSTYQITAAMLVEHRFALVLARADARETLIGLGVLSATLQVTRRLFVLVPVAALAGLVPSPLTTIAGDPGLGWFGWCQILACALVAIFVQILVICALGFFIASLVPTALGSIVTLSIFLISHASAGLTSSGSGSTLVRIAAMPLKLLPRFADLTPENLLGNQGRIVLSVLAVAALHGLAVAVVLVSCTGIVFRQKDL